MGCAITPPPEYNHDNDNLHPFKMKKQNTIVEETTQTKETPQTANSSQISDNCSDKTDYERILSSPGLLEIPDKFKKWFPSRHGHTNITDLFKWHCELGHTAISSVHEIEYKSQICAVKQIAKDHEYGRMLFETEAQVLSKLKHNGIIQLIDVLFDENYYYLVLQKADFDLHYILTQKRYLSENKTRNIIYSVLKTIRYMHRKNLVHRDLKPENIMFVSTDTNHPLLIDFGDVEMVEKDKIYTEFVGTSSYMSPERLGEHKGWELKKSDIWAIAAIAYEMYCGRPCFVGDTQKQIFGRILRGTWVWPKDRVPSDDFKDFIEQCLSHDAKNRPSAMEALQHQWFAVKRKDKEQCNISRTRSV